VEKWEWREFCEVALAALKCVARSHVADFLFNIYTPPRNEKLQQLDTGTASYF